MPSTVLNTQHSAEYPAHWAQCWSPAQCWIPSTSSSWQAVDHFYCCSIYCLHSRYLVLEWSLVVSLIIYQHVHATLYPFTLQHCRYYLFVSLSFGVSFVFYLFIYVTMSCNRFYICWFCIFDRQLCSAEPSQLCCCCCCYSEALLLNAVDSVIGNCFQQSWNWLWPYPEA